MDLEYRIRKLFNLSEAPRCGYSENEIEQIERKLSVKFPQTLRNYYVLFGKNRRLNINYELFKLKDVFVENNQYLVFGKEYYIDQYFGVNKDDLWNNNPPVRVKTMERSDEDFFEFDYVWDTWYDDTETFLLEKAMESGLSGGLKYRIDLFKGQSAVLKSLSDIKAIKLDSVKEIRLPWYYTDDYDYALETVLNGKNEIIILHFGTEKRDVYRQMIKELYANGIKAEREKNKYSEEYQVYKEFRYHPTLEFLPGDYNGKRRGENSIFLKEDAVRMFLDLLHESNEKFDFYGISTEYDKAQINILIKKLSDRLCEMRNNRNFSFVVEGDNLDYYDTKNVDYRRYKRQIIKMFIDLIEWLENINEEKMNILGV